MGTDCFEDEVILEVEYADETVIASAADHKNGGGCLACGGAIIALTLSALFLMSLSRLY